MKRTHKKSGSLSFPSLTSMTSNPTNIQRLKDETDVPTKSPTPSEPELATPVNAPLDMEPATADDEEEEHEPADDDERYCYCQGVSYGEMVACDRDDCPRQWFHLECIGLKSVPKSAKWYCEECKDVLARGEKAAGKGKSGNGNGNGNGK